MKYISMIGFVLVLSLITMVHGAININMNQEASFDENYVVTWGRDHVLKLNQGKVVQLSMDHSSGNADGTHFSHVDPSMADIVTAFYLTSKGNIQDEVDFEFLGNREGKPITIQTYVFTKGKGIREQRFVLWFDPTEDFHAYRILWNPYHIVFYVDNIPIRVFKNNTRGTSYPSKPMQVVSSLWNGEDWATDGGKAKINWAYAPFKAHFQSFSESGCHVEGVNTCGSSTYWSNTGKYVGLSDSKQKAYENARAKYMNYDYCSDHSRFDFLPNECQWNR